MHDLSALPPSPSVPLARGPFAQWLLAEGWRVPDASALTKAISETLLGLGLPLFRLRLAVRNLHPEFLGLSCTWQRGRPEIDVFQPPHKILVQDMYRLSPLAAILDEGAAAIRRRLEGPGAVVDYPIVKELRAAGATDYVAMALEFADGRRSALTLASDRPGGFTPAELAMVDDALPVLSRIVENLSLRLTAQAILATYLGRLSGERVLQGLIRRGDGEDIFAVLWLADMRASTALADRMPRAQYLQLLNEFYDCMARPVLDGGGEILKFIGDGVFGIFPIPVEPGQPPTRAATAVAAAQALAATRRAATRVRALNRLHRRDGRPPLRYGIALHLGEVTYGNVGVKKRLDFTVIGPAANEIARLEKLCRVLRREVIISAPLAAVITEPLIALGAQALHGIREPQEVFTLP